MYLKKLFYRVFPPTINVLVRTSNRPNYFKACYNSIVNQTYNNVRIIVSYDNDQSLEYLDLYDHITKIRVDIDDYSDVIPPVIKRDIGQYKFPYNLYLNTLGSYVKNGFIMYLDDDDIFTNDKSVENLVKNINSRDDLIFWRVQFPDGIIIPEDDYFRKEPVYCHISGIGFAFHKKYIDFAQWDGWKGSDYAVATKLYNAVPNKVYIGEVLTGLQRNTGWGGQGDQKDKIV